MSKKSRVKHDKKKKLKSKALYVARERQRKRAKQIESTKTAIKNVWPEIQKKFAEQDIKKAQHEARYGSVRQQITADLKGNKFVAVGTQLYYGKKWNTFPEFLIGYLATKLTAEWGNAEIAKPEDDQHQIVKLYRQFCHWQQKQTEDDDGIVRCTASGVSASYMHLAYDLYALDHDSKLQQEVIRRLKNRSGYQGARYELTVAATFLRAGFIRYQI